MTIIEGHISEERILFSMENNSDSFSAIFKGMWDAGTLQFSGTWKTAKSTGETHEYHGDWIMEFDQPLTKTDINERFCFPVHYDPQHFRNIYFKENKFSDAETGTLLSLSVIFTLLSIGSGILVSAGAHSFFYCLSYLFYVGGNHFFNIPEKKYYSFWKKEKSDRKKYRIHMCRT